VNRARPMKHPIAVLQSWEYDTAARCVIYTEAVLPPG
jgi:hypothetical protein